jgi:hypothetical protein
MVIPEAREAKTRSSLAWAGYLPAAYGNAAARKDDSTMPNSSGAGPRLKNLGSLTRRGTTRSAAHRNRDCHFAPPLRPARSRQASAQSSRDPKNQPSPPRARLAPSNAQTDSGVWAAQVGPTNAAKDNSHCCRFPFARALFAMPAGVQGGDQPQTTSLPWPRRASTAEHQHIWALLKSQHRSHK